MRIGIVGSGMMGSTLGQLWVRAGHEVCFSSRHPERLSPLVEKAGAGAQAGDVETAASFGEAIFLGVPFGALPELATRLGPLVVGKVVLDAGNPFPARDGAIAREVLASRRGSGAYTAARLPGARVVKAFNTVYFKTLETEAHRRGAGVGVPLASDDGAALALAATLVRDAGFEPVIVGRLETAARFDVGSPVWNTSLSGAEVAKALGVEAKTP
ncbi:MAG: NAD(P)-binding domain-containing protein [Polyangiaceae bacterium]|jgi:8-hydroxy-5-deazaflavin:NADPH oxidoreductase|nr:NAD(P)-binding domain-containing protein [Polyangiaceae bacterium]